MNCDRNSMYLYMFSPIVPPMRPSCSEHHSIVSPSEWILRLRDFFYVDLVYFHGVPFSHRTDSGEDRKQIPASLSRLGQFPFSFALGWAISRRMAYLSCFGRLHGFLHPDLSLILVFCYVIATPTIRRSNDCWQTCGRPRRRLQNRCAITTRGTTPV